MGQGGVRLQAEPGKDVRLQAEFLWVDGGDCKEGGRGKVGGEGESKATG